MISISLSVLESSILILGLGIFWSEGVNGRKNTSIANAKSFDVHRAGGAKRKSEGVNRNII